MKCWSTMTAETERDQLMRKAQISIRMELFGDQAANGHSEVITVYADSNNCYETINAGLFELLSALQQQGHKLPSFGVREHSKSHREPKEEHNELLHF